MRPVAIRLDHAVVRFGDRTALKDITAAFSPGEVTAVIGGDGAGKSTLLRLLAGRLPLHSGTGTGLPVDRRSIGYQPADSGVWRNLSVAENLEFVARAYGLPPEPTRTRSRELLARAGLDRVTRRPAGRLSGGMRQKLGVVLATLHQPGLVLLDEPTTGVDPVSRAELWNLISGTAADGATVVFATTYLDEAERASGLLLLGAGELLASGTPDQVIAGTPGAVARAPIVLDAARRELASPNAWRRGDTVYRWQSAPGPAEDLPEGFTAAPGDLENTSIALLLRTGGEQRLAASLSAPRAPGERQKADGPLLEAVDVTRAYGSFTALDRVSLTLQPGETVGLLGGNGAGKTTLMRILLGLETPTTGASAMFGRRASLDTRSRIGYVAQGLGLYPSLSAIENLEFAASVHGADPDERIRALVRELGGTPVSSLPLGTKRILAYLTATVHRPELLVLDEPTSGMDALTRARLWRDLGASADTGTGILVTTHYMQEAAQCDRLVILASGRVIAAGTVAEITAARTSITVATSRWEDAFARLREAGIPALLDGRALRIPGASRDEVAAALAPLGGRHAIAEGPATLEETMMLAGGEHAAG